jgi:general stress protein YciG
MGRVLLKIARRAAKPSLGPSFYAEIGRRRINQRQQGPEFYSRIGKKGGERGRGTPKQQSSRRTNG